MACTLRLLRSVPLVLARWPRCVGTSSMRFGAVFFLAGNKALTIFFARQDFNNETLIE